MGGRIDTGQALVALHALQSWRRLPQPRDGNYGAGWFYGGDWLAAVRRPNRRVALRLARLQTCLRCGAALAPDSTGDHLLARARGGPEGAENYIPLCGACNSSKGTDDSLAWWKDSGRAVTALPTDVLCAYSRLLFQNAERGGRLRDPAPRALADAVDVLLDALPSDAHRRAALGASDRALRLVAA